MFSLPNPAPAFIFLFAVAVLHTAFAHNYAALGEPCYGPDEILCESAPTTIRSCRKDDGRLPIFRVRTMSYPSLTPPSNSGDFGRCVNMRKLNEACTDEFDVCGKEVLNLATDDPHQISGVQLVCKSGVCRIGSEGKLKDSCDPRVLAGGGLPCRSVSDRYSGEGPLHCELVSGYPGAMYGCVSRDIPVGGACPTGIASPVNRKVYKRCVSGASCTGGGEFCFGKCTAD